MNNSKNSNIWFNLVEASVIIRLVLAPFIFFAPVLVTILFTVADGFDGELYKRAGYARPRYSIYDKILDYYWYVFVLAYVVVANVPLKWVLLVFLFTAPLANFYFY